MTDSLPADQPPPFPDQPTASEESSELPKDTLEQRNLKIAANTYLPRNLHYGNSDAQVACATAVTNMLNHQNTVYGYFELKEDSPKDQPHFALVLLDKSTNLTLTLDPQDTSRPLLLSQDKIATPPASDPANTPDAIARFNAEARAGLSFQTILETMPEANELINATLDQANHQAQKINSTKDGFSVKDALGYAESGVLTASSLGIAKQISTQMLPLLAIKSSIEELANSRPLQAVINLLNLIPGLGQVATEILQTTLHAAGADVNPGLTTIFTKLAGSNALSPDSDPKTYRCNQNTSPDAQNTSLPSPISPQAEEKPTSLDDGKIDLSAIKSPDSSPDTMRESASALPTAELPTSSVNPHTTPLSHP